MIKYFSPRDYAVLRQLRERFLNETAGRSDYWQTPEHLELYDTTFAERIGWKWDAVLDELQRRGWRPRSTRLVDWGCGTGVANRRVLAAFPQLTTLTVHDRSPQARMYAAEKARAAFPAVDVSRDEPVVDGETMLLVSHVINELPAAELDRLLALARGAGEILWVEAGTHADSRRLIDVRERLLGEFAAVAPCTHQAVCGMVTAKNAHHWCHHFAVPPSAIFQDARWAEFGKEMSIDLRSVPYSFLVLTRAGGKLPTREGYSRVIGEPREAKGFSRILSCHEKGVAEFVLQKRDAPDLFKAAHKGRLGPVQRWEIADGKIVGGEELRVASEDAGL